MLSRSFKTKLSSIFFVMLASCATTVKPTGEDSTELSYGQRQVALAVPLAREMCLVSTSVRTLVSLAATADGGIYAQGDVDGFRAGVTYGAERLRELAGGREYSDDKSPLIADENFRTCTDRMLDKIIDATEAANSPDLLFSELIPAGQPVILVFNQVPCSNQDIMPYFGNRVCGRPYSLQYNPLLIEWAVSGPHAVREIGYRNQTNGLDEAVDPKRMLGHWNVPIEYDDDGNLYWPEQGDVDTRQLKVGTLHKVGLPK